MIKNILLIGFLIFCEMFKSVAGQELQDISQNKKIILQIDRTQKYQKIDGFGIFGAKTVWWSKNNDSFYTDDWGEKIINDLGITIWRNELFPTTNSNNLQDVEWEKQKDVINGLFTISKNKKIPLKFILSVWSPPAYLKCAIDLKKNPIMGAVNPSGTKNGGTLDPGKYEQYAEWILYGIKKYHDLGINIYAISPQNEPLFVEPYNSCYYNANTSALGSYNDLLRKSIPIIKQNNKNIKIFGPENMLQIEGGNDRKWFYSANILKDTLSISNIDILAVHGYSDGINPSNSVFGKTYWETFKKEYADIIHKPIWMSETSGYGENWVGDSMQKFGAFDLGLDIFSALYYGNVSAWIWWQGSNEHVLNEQALMKGLETGKKYAVSKQFYRFIRPESIRVKSEFINANQVFALAFENLKMGSFTIVLINKSKSEVTVDLKGEDLPNNFDYYITSNEKSENCKKRNSFVNKKNIHIPSYSIVTLVNGNVYE